ncbi:hypothetical protein KPH14_005991 [Odynerus spinipes]|uniref:Uncharacterized protein n=1 Tax=Odynerus spinipes TaxID=1348599 RepID=A0AAD9VP54_9HYME|nr:hypothetical protein KPH14_005991 [Odynerus spinipes]
METLLMFEFNNNSVLSSQNKLPNEKSAIESEDDVEEVTSKHKIFRDEDSKVILDVDEERDRIFLDNLRIQEEVHDPYSGLNLDRKSQRHMNALAEYVRKVYKLKMHKKDIVPKIEGAKSKDWIALDLGNIALHIFSAAARERYDLETLWTVGSDYDDETHKPETDIMEQYNAFLKVFEPAET